MKIEHVAMYVQDLEGVKEFFIKFFDAESNDKYHNVKTGFESYFLTFEDGARLEIMTRPDMVVKEKNIMQITNKEELTNVVNKILDTNPNLVTDYHNGKRVFDYLIGQIMKETKGKANPSISSNILKQELERRMN